MAENQGAEAVTENVKKDGKSKVFQHDTGDDIGDDDLFNFLDFPEDVESAIAEVGEALIAHFLELNIKIIFIFETHRFSYNTVCEFLC